MIHLLLKRWEKDKEFFSKKELGELQDFIKDVLSDSEIFNLKKGLGNTDNIKRKYEFTIETSKENRRADFVIFINGIDVVIPVEVERFNNIENGVKQIFQYQMDWNKKYGILTDGYRWRFYRSNIYREFDIEYILKETKDFLTYWNEYIKPENYYISLFNEKNEDANINMLDLNIEENRVIFFNDITHCIYNFKAKMKSIGFFQNITNDKILMETSYAYLIQFILYKVLVDNEYKKFSDEYNNMINKIKKSLLDSDFYSIIINEVKKISQYISKNIYTPFENEQENINDKLIYNLSIDLTVDDIAPWLDIILFINRYKFSDIKNEIFGFIYENYLKDLYGDKKKGQYFTDPSIVNFMLKEIGYNEKEINKRVEKNMISIIDISCGAGTFLYSAVDKIINSFFDGKKYTSNKVENLVNDNIFGLDIEEFPLYLAEMNILMRMLPLIVNDNYENPIHNKFKIFKTKDSISEFLNTGINSKLDDEIDLFSHLDKTALDYPSFMRDEKDLENMLLSLKENSGVRERFDYVIGNPPYIGYNDCCKQKIEFTNLISDKDNNSITLGNVYGMNLHSVPKNRKKYRPNPNLYAFFIALGLALLKDDGELCYIIPQTILTAGDLDVLRYHLANDTSIKSIIIFENSMFINRGLKQNKNVPTSSLIIHVKKSIKNKNNKVKIVNYGSINISEDMDFNKYINSKNKKVKYINQSMLLNNINNWNFIKKNNQFIEFINLYNKNDKSNIYYDHKIANNKFKSLFYYDGGYSIDEKQKLNKESFFIYPKLNNDYYTIQECSGYWNNERYNKKDKNYIGLRQGNQDYNFLDSKYKVIWSYANAKKFFYTDKPVIWARNQFCGIGSDNKNEIIFLFSILNSKTNLFLLKELLLSNNEKDFLLSLNSIKEFIHIPIINDSNKNIKNEILQYSKKILDIEEYKLKDFVSFSTTEHRFNYIKVEKNNLILRSKNKEIKQKILSNSELVNDIICKNCNGMTNITLNNLKFLRCVDTKKQSIYKDYIDDLVFLIYFNIKINKVNFSNSDYIKSICRKNKFYKLIHS